METGTRNDIAISFPRSKAQSVRYIPHQTICHKKRRHKTLVRIFQTLVFKLPLQPHPAHDHFMGPARALNHLKIKVAKFAAISASHVINSSKLVFYKSRCKCSRLGIGKNTNTVIRIFLPQAFQHYVLPVHQ